MHLSIHGIEVEHNVYMYIVLHAHYTHVYGCKLYIYQHVFKQLYRKHILVHAFDDKKQKL